MTSSFSSTNHVHVLQEASRSAPVSDALWWSTLTPSALNGTQIFVPIQTSQKCRSNKGEATEGGLAPALSSSPLPSGGSVSLSSREANPGQDFIGQFSQFGRYPGQDIDRVGRLDLLRKLSNSMSLGVPSNPFENLFPLKFARGGVPVGLPGHRAIERIRRISNSPC